jgi:lipopolysaccharide biosynthesis glycosyltransferase
MTPITVLYTFNETYFELASVSIFSLISNTKRDCIIYVFVNSVSEESLAQLLRLETLFENVKFHIHHISDTAFDDIVSIKTAKATWYSMLAPMILCDLDKILLIEPDTLICRDISELFDLDIANCFAAVHPYPPSLDDFDNFTFYFSGCSARFNAGVILYNLKAIRESNLFNIQRLSENMKFIRSFASVDLTHVWAENESYLSSIFTGDRLARLESKYNSFLNINLASPACSHFDLRFDFHEMYESYNDPVIIHFVGYKPNNESHATLIRDFRFVKWWEYLALSPFANPMYDAGRLEAINQRIQRHRAGVHDREEYFRSVLFFNFLDATKKLNELVSAGYKVVIYGAGKMGITFFRLARFMDVPIYMICDLLRPSQFVDGIKVESPIILSQLVGKCVIVLTLENPRDWTDTFSKLIDIGYLHRHIMPICEPLAPGGRRWCEIMDSVKP